jgi:hypothetical protein
VADVLHHAGSHRQRALLRVRARRHASPSSTVPRLRRCSEMMAAALGPVTAPFTRPGRCASALGPARTLGLPAARSCPAAPLVHALRTTTDALGALELVRVEQLLLHACAGAAARLARALCQSAIPHDLHFHESSNPTLHRHPSALSLALRLFPKPLQFCSRTVLGSLFTSSSIHYLDYIESLMVIAQELPDLFRTRHPAQEHWTALESGPEPRSAHYQQVLEVGGHF